MSVDSFDPEILQDFLTESGELLEQLEADLVSLEETPNDLELLNQIFRALHTIKGSASFLAFNELVEIAHAAETALNAARNQEIVVTSREMDLLLEAVDVVKVQFGEIQNEGRCASSAEPQLVSSLEAIASGQSPAQGGEAGPGGAPESQDDTPGKPLNLSDSKLDLLEPLTADVEESVKLIHDAVSRLSEPETRDAAAVTLREQSDELLRTVEFFEIPESMALVTPLSGFFDSYEHSDSVDYTQLIPRLEGLCLLIEHQNDAMRSQRLLEWDTTSLVEHIAAAYDGSISEDASFDSGLDGVEALAFEGISFGLASDDAASETAAEGAPEAAAAAAGDPAPKRQAVGQIEQTIRVDVERLEELMNLVGELVLQKNRVLGISEEIEKTDTDSALQEQVEMTAGVLDRITGDIQLAVMRTRMQPLNKLLGKYPRLIRDLAAKTGKEISLVIEGGETEVDKTVIEELGDPLVHLLRNSADHGIEMPEDREAAGKDRKGTITIRAGHAGSHVSIQVIDDGKGLSREVIANKAIEKGIVTTDQLEHMSDEEVFRLILAAGFSTAAELSDLSGRGVGMDVVRTNIEQNLKGQLTIESEQGKGTTLTIRIPLTLAIMPAMMVAVGDEVYAIPLGNIEEIVRPTPESITSVGRYPVVHLRGQVIPLVSGAEALGAQGEAGEENFVVLVNHSSRTVGVRVSRVIGQQEIVMKPLDGLDREGPLSGATIRNDGSVSLIVDIAKLMSSAAIVAQCINASEAAHAAAS